MKISIRLVKRIRAGLQDKCAIIGMQGIIDLVNGSLNDVKTINVFDQSPYCA